MVFIGWGPLPPGMGSLTGLMSRLGTLRLLVPFDQPGYTNTVCRASHLVSRVVTLTGFYRIPIQWG